MVYAYFSHPPSQLNEEITLNLSHSLPTPTRADMTFPKHARDRLIFVASLKRSPCQCDNQKLISRM